MMKWLYIGGIAGVVINCLTLRHWFRYEGWGWNRYFMKTKIGQLFEDLVLPGMAIGSVAAVVGVMWGSLIMASLGCIDIWVYWRPRWFKGLKAVFA